MNLPIDWQTHLTGYLAEHDLQRLTHFVETVYMTEDVLPPREHLFTALKLCSFDATRVVILGQDPYPTPGHAHGLAFSVQPPTLPPPSLKNILTEIANDVGPSNIHYGDLRPWAQQGILLLNTILTVRAGHTLAHAKKGWEPFTDAIIRCLSSEKIGLVFLLWGNMAKQKSTLIDTTRHTILTAAHPSPLSARNGFFGCRHFSETNRLLSSPIRW